MSYLIGKKKKKRKKKTREGQVFIVFLFKEKIGTALSAYRKSQRNRPNFQMRERKVKMKMKMKMENFLNGKLYKHLSITERLAHIQDGQSVIHHS